MPMWKRILIAVAALALLFVLVLAALPLFFQDEIEERVRVAINERVDARVTFGEAGLNFFRHFPNLAFSLDDLTVTGVGPFEGDTLAHVGAFNLVVDVRSAIGMLRRGDPLVVRSILVDRPYLHARVLEDGRASWDIMKAVREATLDEPGPAESSSVRVALRRFAVEDGRVVYDDARSGVLARVQGLQHTLSGDLSAERTTVESRTIADSVTFRLAGVPYLTDARIEADVELDADLAARRFVFRENRVMVNRLGLGFDGAFTALDDGAELDLDFAADRADFREILSLVPAIYTQDFDGLETSGWVTVNGFVRGRQGPESVPSFSLNAHVDDGAFRYPDLPLPVQRVFLDLAVANPTSDLDGTTVELNRFELAIGEEPFRGTFRLATPVSDPEVAVTVEGTIDLESLGAAVKLEGIEELRGTVIADAAVHARSSWIEAEEWERVEATGRVELREVAASGEALRHPVAIDELRLELSPQYADFPVVRARAGASDFRGTGRLENLLAFGLRGEELRGSARISSDYIALDEWKRQEARDLEFIPVPANVDLILSASVDSMTFGDVVMTDARGDLHVKDERVTLDRFALSTLGGAVVTSGWYDTSDPGRPAFDFDLGMAGLDVPATFAAFNTVRALAPAAQYAAGAFSADLTMTGVLGTDMMPVLEVLDGGGGIRTQGVSVQGMPVLHRLAEAVRIDRLRDPALSDFAASIEIRDGRLHVRPFDVGMGPAQVTVAGSNGIDRSLDYRLQLEVPRSLLGAEANRLVAGLLERSGRVGVDLGAAEAVRLDALVRGTMNDPAVSVDFGDAIADAGTGLRDQARTRLQEEAERRAAEARDQVDSAVDDAAAAARERAAAFEAEARADARARADSIIADAEVQAERIRAEAARAAANVRREADEQADRLVAEASNPVAKRAAEAAGNRLRLEADARASQITAEADRRAEQVLTAARERADAVVGEAGGDAGGAAGVESAASTGGAGPSLRP